jgi:hypothetical protein
VALPNVDVLIGMDVLADCLLVLDGPGKQFILAFLEEECSLSLQLSDGG